MCAAFVAAVLFTALYARGANSTITPINTYQPCTFFTATTTTATSTNTSDGSGSCLVAGATNVVLYFARGDATGTGNAGASQFRVQVTPNGTTWVDYNHLASSTTFGQVSLQPLVGTTTLSTGTSTQMYRMNDLGFYAIRCIVVETTDGEHTCTASVTY